MTPKKDPNAPWTVEHSVVTYQTHGWGAPYFSVSKDGHVIVRPDPQRDSVINLYESSRDDLFNSSCKFDPMNWALETRAANNLIRLGWRPADVPVGAVIVIEGFRARNGSPTASIATVTFEDGRRLFAGPPDGPARQ